jgi:hypothetical protein
MNLWLKVALWSLGIGMLGIFTAFASGAIGICGNGGWGIIAFFIGMAALVTSLVSGVTWFVLFVRQQLLTKESAQPLVDRPDHNT